METKVNPKERFRKGFVLTLTLAYTVMFLAMLSGFFEALLLAAIFSGLTYPLYCWLLQRSQDWNSSWDPILSPRPPRFCRRLPNANTWGPLLSRPKMKLPGSVRPLGHPLPESWPVQVPRDPDWP